MCFVNNKKFCFCNIQGIISNGEILPQEPLFLNNESEEDDEGDVDDIIILHMDIRQPLSTLRLVKIPFESQILNFNQLNLLF